MTISNESVKTTVQGNGVQTTFSYNFLIPSKSVAQLYLRDTATGDATLLPVSAWSLAGAGNPQGGTFTYPVAPPALPASAAQTLMLVRDVPNQQQTNLGNQGAYYPQAVEGGLDWLEMQIQELQEEVGRCVRVSVQEPSPVAPLPKVETRRNTYAAWDANGALVPTVGTPPAVPVSTFGATLIAAADAPTARVLLGTPSIATLAASGGSDTIGFTQAGTGAVARTSQSKMRDTFNVRDFGAKGDLSQDDAPAIQACVNAAAGRRVHVPVGQYLLNSSINSSLPVHIVGEGTGAGPGSAAQSNSNCTQFLLNYANPTAFSVVSDQPSIFQNFQINVNPSFRGAGRTGFGIVLYASATPTATTANTLIDNVAFNWVGVGIGIFRPNYPRITNCYFGDWASDAIYMQTIAPAEGGGGMINKCYFFGDPAITQRSCIFMRCGYFIISENEILGAQYGVRIEVADFDAGFLRIINNTIEEGYYGGVLASALGVLNVSMLDISGNEFSSLFTVPTYTSAILLDDTPNRLWLKNVTIHNNTIVLFGATSAGFIRAAAGQNMQITGNVLHSNSTAALGISVQGVTVNTCLAAPVLVADNTFLGTFTIRYAFNSITGLTTLRDQLGMTAAQLPANCRDGSNVYVTDGRSTSLGNYTIIGGGTGAFAFRQRGAWLTPGDLL